MRLGREYRSVEDSRMTLTEHLQELRARLLKSLIAVAICTIVVGVWLAVIGVFEVIASFGIRKASNELGNGAASA